MKNIFKVFNLVNWHEKKTAFITYEISKKFIYNVFVLVFSSICIVYIWYFGVQNLLLFNTSSVYNNPAENTKLNKEAVKGITLRSDIVLSNSKADDKTTSSTSVSSSNVKTVNEITAPRTVTASAVISTAGIEIAPENYNKAKKTIYRGKRTTAVAITFDDGYDRNAVKKVLEVLKKEKLKATFFVIGTALNKNADLWKQAIADGNQVCNHTNSHKSLSKLTNKEIEAEISGWENTATKVLGKDYVDKMKKEFPYVRFPGGDGSNDKRILYIAQSLGYTVIGWDVDSYTGVIRPLRKTASVQAIAYKISSFIPSKCGKGSIVLMHFNSYDTGNLERTFDEVKRKGYDIQTVSELIN
jgi:peptidoglycan-N-acetylmuramic acid deacetylase